MSNSTKQNTSKKNAETHFGFRTVREEEKASLVHDVFASVANRYDVMNDLMSGGLHRLWKQRFVQRLNPQPGERFLDVAGGTGDIAFLIHDRLSSKERATADHPAITISDINPAMLEVGKDRAIDRGILHGLEWNCANAEALPFPDMSFDAYTIAFGIRNVTHIDKALSEAYRVLKPGGRFLCLEFSHVKNPLLARAYDLYSFNVIPMVGRAVTGDRDSYQYLVESIRKFPDQDTFERMIQAAGFANTSHQNMNNGVVAIHAGWRV